MLRRGTRGGPAGITWRTLGSSFNVRVETGTLHVTGGFCRVKAIGFGCVLIRRTVLVALARSGGARVAPVGKLARYADLGFGDEFHDFFSHIPLEDGDYLSEDYSFCKRVRGLGDTEIWGYGGDGIGHVGRFDF